MFLYNIGIDDTQYALRFQEFGPISATCATRHSHNDAPSSHTDAKCTDCHSRSPTKNVAARWESVLFLTFLSHMVV